MSETTDQSVDKRSPEELEQMAGDGAAYEQSLSEADIRARQVDQVEEDVADDYVSETRHNHLMARVRELERIVKDAALGKGAPTGTKTEGSNQSSS